MLAMAACGIAWAEGLEVPKNQLELSSELYHFQYKEPDVSVEFEGPMFGLAGVFTHHHPNRLMFKADARGAVGTVDYTGSGRIDDIRDYVLEGRMAAGYDFPMGESGLLTPFFGLGYRYLNDDSSGKVSSTGAAGYERESNYFYSPAGLEYTVRLNDQWNIGVTAEYDIFWKGQQKSHLEDADPAFDILTNDQNSGYGARGSIRLSKTSEKFNLVIEPFIRWWSIDNSETASVTYAGTILGTGYEPKNETLEVGGRIGIVF